MRSQIQLYLHYTFGAFFRVTDNEQKLLYLVPLNTTTIPASAFLLVE
ncbi:hypothetical protein SAMN04487930_104243 [Cytophaga hutchinsonii ATCC 33406]|nr:hypothetical protein SAMN04487930_104243 [Cytophaga hutchinsonii ATCC 33406]